MITSAQTESINSISVIRARVLERLRSAPVIPADPLPADIVELIETLSPEGRWPGINYDDTNRINWSPATHLNNLSLLTDIYGHCPKAPVVLRDALVLALQGWVDAAPRCDNWWWNDIGAPRRLSGAMQLLETELPVPLTEKLLQLFPDAPKMTGQNRVWYSELVVYHGLIANRPDMIAAGAAGIAGTVKVTSEEGIQVDGSFWQHGPQIYNGGYGSVFLGDTSRWATLLRGTPYAFSAESRAALSKLANEGTLWMIRNELIDPLVTGRELIRDEVLQKKQRALSRALADLRELGLVADARESPLGHRYFWRGDYSVQQRPGYRASLRIMSSGRIGTETFNGENLLGVYLPFGTTLIVRSGLEYEGIYPVWDWRRLPGTTVLQLSEQPRMTAQLLHAGNHYAAGVCDGRNAQVAFEQNHKVNPVLARKSWFYFDDGFVALVADIRPNPEYTPVSHGLSIASVFTTINQTRLNTPVSIGHVDGTRETLPPNQGVAQPVVWAQKPTWVFHDGVGYVPAANASFNLEYGERSGDWHRVDAGRDGSPVTLPVFELAINHGPIASTEPTATSSYYTVLPDASEDEVAAFAAESPIRVVSNTRSIQAVRHAPTGLTGISFFEPGKVEIGAGYTVTVDTHCAVLVREVSADKLEVSIASPGDKDAAMKVVVEVEYAGGKTRRTIEFPAGPMSGSSQTFTLSF